MMSRLPSLLLLTTLPLTLMRFSCGQCPEVDLTGGHWAKGETVGYRISSDFSPIEKRAIRNAVARWNKANQENNSGVSFQEIGDRNGKVALDIVKGSLSNRAPVRLEVASVSRYRIVLLEVRVIRTARIVVDLTHSGWDRSNSEYPRFLVKAILHEFGHSMGLAEIPAGAQRSRRSVMNAFNGPNDAGNWLPSTVTECDNQTVQGLYRSRIEELSIDPAVTDGSEEKPD